MKEQEPVGEAVQAAIALPPDRAAADAAFSELYLRHIDRIHRSCRKVLGNDAIAQEIAQDAFLQAWRSLDGNDVRCFGAWVWRIAYHLCLNHLKRHSSTHERDSISLASDAVMESFESGITFAEELARILESLSARQRVVAKLFFIEGYSYKEICARTGFSENEVKSLVQNGRLRIQKAWERLQPGRPGSNAV